MTVRGRFFWKLLLGHVVLAVVVLFVSLFVLVRALEQLDAERGLNEQVQFTDDLALLVTDRLGQAYQTELEHTADSLGTSVREGRRITLILPDGRVLADSEADEADLDSHADRPEVIAALEEGVGRSTRWSNSVARELRYTARRVGSADDPEGVVRVSVAVDQLGDVPATLGRVAWWLIILSALTATALAIGLAALWSDRINRLTRAAQSLARGDLGAPIESPGGDEVAGLARSLNRVRARFSRQLDALEHQRATLESILANLNEGIVLINEDGRVVMMNEAARSMLGVAAVRTGDGASRSKNLTIEQCIPNHDLLRLLSEPANDTHDSQDTQIEVRLDHPDLADERTVLAGVVPLSLHGQALHDESVRVEAGESSPPVGRLLVLTDITELTRTIRMKTDFVAHASHELRTPLAAMRGAVETLMQMDLAAGDKAAPRFLEMIVRHSQRLEALAADLLSLAHVEAGARRFEIAPIKLAAFRKDVESRWRDTIDKKKLQWSFEAPDDMHSFSANAYLLGLILDNLLDNAVKFTDPGGRIAVRFEPHNGQLAVSVSDTGCGIPPEEQSRVFERFYQATPTRAATVAPGSFNRGTGLGLSIVRHAVKAMGGTVSLESKPKKGTTVTLRLPQSG